MRHILFLLALVVLWPVAASAQTSRPGIAVTNGQGINTALITPNIGTVTGGDASLAVVLGRTLASKATDRIDVMSSPYNAQGDLQFYNGNFSIGVGTTTLSATSALFGAVTAGQTIVLPQPGATPAYLITTISSVTDSSHLVLAAPATATLSSYAIRQLPIGTDDTAAINAAWAAVTSSVQFTTGIPRIATASLFFPQRQYLTINGINFSGHNYITANVEGNNSLIYGASAGYPVIDAFGSRWLRLHDLTIDGDCNSMPNMGLAIGRTSTQVSADYNFEQHIQFAGCFSFTAFYNNASEQSASIDLRAQNNYSGSGSATSFGAVYDGLNHWAGTITSRYQTLYTTPDVLESFKSNQCINCTFESYGTSPLWLGHVEDFNAPGTYIYGNGSTNMVSGIELYNASNAPNKQVYLDAHVESQTTPADFKYHTLLTGTWASPTIYGLTIRDMESHANTALIGTGSTLTGAVTLSNLSVDWASNSAYPSSTLVDNPSQYSADGTTIYVPSASAFNLTAFSGVWCDPIYGCRNLLPQPSVLSAANWTVSGGVSSVTITGSGSYLVQSGLSYLPTIAFAAAPSGGTTATATITSMRMFSPGIITGGTGYTNNDNCSFFDASSNLLFKAVLIVSGGAATGVKQVTNQATPTQVPAGPVTMTCPSGGSGISISQTRYLPNAYSITAGSGYVTNPTATLSSTYSSGSLAAYGNTTTQLTASAGSSLVINSSGITTNGSLITTAPSLDGASVDVALGSSYLVTGNVDTVVATNSTALASTTVSLPTAVGNSQTFTLITSAGAITALTFSPSATNWTNGSSLPAYSSITVRWDSTSGVWTSYSSSPVGSLPAPTATTLGGIESLAATAHQWVNSISTAGVPSSTQPAFSDLTGSAAASQLPTGSATALGVLQVDGATITASSGIITAAGCASSVAVFTASQGSSSLPTLCGRSPKFVHMDLWGPGGGGGGGIVCAASTSCSGAGAGSPGLYLPVDVTFGGGTDQSSATTYTVNIGSGGAGGAVGSGGGTPTVNTNVVLGSDTYFATFGAGGAAGQSNANSGGAAPAGSNGNGVAATGSSGAVATALGAVNGGGGAAGTADAYFGIGSGGGGGVNGGAGPTGGGAATGCAGGGAGGGVSSGGAAFNGGNGGSSGAKAGGLGGVSGTPNGGAGSNQTNRSWSGGGGGYGATASNTAGNGGSGTYCAGGGGGGSAAAGGTAGVGGAGGGGFVLMRWGY